MLARLLRRPGVFFDESYDTPGSHMQKLDMACGWRPHSEPGWPDTIWGLILELTERKRPHGELFEYRSIETDVLGFVMERVTGKRLANRISELSAGYAMANGGFNATLRDYARFALLHVRRGNLNGKQIVPQGWLSETRSGNHEIFQGDCRLALPRGAYHNQFWIARGICGQYIYQSGSRFRGGQALDLARLREQRPLGRDDRSRQGDTRAYRLTGVDLALPRLASSLWVQLSPSR
jgi:CubicO group peptidase (beta-lactamase class C family)